MPTNASATIQHAIDHVMEQDVTARWEAASVRISALHKYLNCQILLSNFTNPIFAPGTDAAYVKETYDYVCPRINL